MQWRLWKNKKFFSNNIDDHFMESAPNARARFSCGKENNCLSEGLYTKERFCYDKENQQLQTKMSTENPGQTVVECGKAAGYIKMVGKKDVQSEQGIE